MATGGITEDSIQNASDEIFDQPCTICEENGRKAEASSCCNTCNKLMCDSCTKLHGQLYNKLRPSPDHVYQVEKVEKYDVRTTTDEIRNFVHGECVLSDGNIVIADQNNRTIKLLNNRYDVIDEHRLSSAPLGLCHIAGTEVAVTFSDFKSKHKLNFFNVIRKNITRLRTAKLDHYCRSITHRNGQLYVCCGYVGLFVHDMDGTNRGTLYTGGWVEDVAISHDDQLVYVTLRGKDLVVLNKDGTILSNLMEEEIIGVFPSVAIAGNNTVFVACFNSSAIIQVDKEGSKKMGTLATDKRWSI